jgi:hypothetical protein
VAEEELRVLILALARHIHWGAGLHTLAAYQRLGVVTRCPQLDPPAHAASESSILASLWLLDSLHDSQHSSATAALTAYLQRLGAFCPLAVATLSLDWPASFCRMRAGLVAAQRDMLHRLNWRLHLDPVKGGRRQSGEALAACCSCVAACSNHMWWMKLS